MSFEVMVEALEEGSGEQFDPDIAAAAIDYLATRARRNQFPHPVARMDLPQEGPENAVWEISEGHPGVRP